MSRRATSSFSVAVLLPWLLYNALSPFLLLVLLPGWLKRARARGHWAEAWRERLGFPNKELRTWARANKPIWIHAVSVGECAVALKFLRTYLPNDPRQTFLLTTTTATGRRLLEEALMPLPTNEQQRVRISWAPLDLLPCALLALAYLRPKMLVLTEAEWWPNWLCFCSWKGVPTAIINARLSPRSAARLAKFHCLVAPLLRQLHWVGLQREEDVAPWKQVGLGKEQLALVGSIKYELSPMQNRERTQLMVREEFCHLLNRLQGDENTPVLMGISTFAGEEQFLTNVTEKLQAKGVKIRLVLVPRHAERAATLYKELTQTGWQVQLRHPLGLKQEAPETQHALSKELLLVNSTGELREWLRLATVAVIGKSWQQSTKGGQNPVEALEAGVLPICGPHMSNFQALVSELKAVGSVEQIEGQSDELASKLAAKLEQILSNPEQTKEAITRGLEQLKTHEGATLRTVDAVKRLIESQA